MSIDIEITAQTRVGELLAYPELERELVACTPSFEKLKNPILRRTVARIATLRQAAEIAGIDVAELVATLRRAAGQTAVATAAVAEPAPETELALPAWVEAGRVVLEIDAETALDRGEHPLAAVERQLRTLGRDELILVQANFKPVPLIDTLRGRGLAVHVGRKDARVWQIWVGQGPSDQDRRST